MAGRGSGDFSEDKPWMRASSPKLGTGSNVVHDNSAAAATNVKKMSVGATLGMMGERLPPTGAGGKMDLRAFLGAAKPGAAPATAAPSGLAPPVANSERLLAAGVSPRKDTLAEKEQKEREQREREREKEREREREKEKEREREKEKEREREREREAKEREKQEKAATLRKQTEPSIAASNKEAVRSVRVPSLNHVGSSSALPTSGGNNIGSGSGDGPLSGSRKKTTTGEGDHSDWLDASVEIERREVILGAELGSGGFGVVYAAKCRGKDVAVKKLRASPSVSLQQERLEALKQEVAIMRSIPHPNIVLLMGFCLEGDTLWVVTERLAGDLETRIIKEKKNYPLHTRLRMAYDCALGMNWLHLRSPPLVHRDLKLSNLLLDENLCVKICDFGLAKNLRVEAGAPVDEEDANKAKVGGSPLYMAPEVMLGEFGPPCDVYSFAIILIELFTQTHAFSDNPKMKRQEAIVYAVSGGARPTIPPTCPDGLANVIRASWDQEPRRRPTFERLLPQLEQLIFETALPDAPSRSMWRDAFGLRMAADWPRFRKALCRTLSATDENARPIRCLERLIAEPSATVKGELQVSVGQWCRVLLWFGPLNAGFLERVESVLRCGWFHGPLDSANAFKLLDKQPDGSFLVRFSEASEPRAGVYTLSRKTKDQVVHQRFPHFPGQGVKFANLFYSDLIKFVTTFENDPNLPLNLPCPGSPYTDLFPELSTTPTPPPNAQNYLTTCSTYDEPN